MAKQNDSSNSKSSNEQELELKNLPNVDSKDDFNTRCENKLTDSSSSSVLLEYVTSYFNSDVKSSSDSSHWEEQYLGNNNI